MKHIFLLGILFCTIFFAPLADAAAVFQGGGLDAGVKKGSQIQGVTKKEPREITTGILKKVLDYTALAASIAIVTAGLFSIFSFCNDQTKEKAKTILIYTVAWLVLILLARGIVTFVTQIE